MGDLSDSVGFWTNLIPSLYSKFIILLVGIILCMKVSFILTLLGFILVPSVIVLNVKISKPIEKASLEARQALGSSNGMLKNILSNVISIKSFNLYDQLGEKYKNTLKTFNKAETKLGKLQALMEPFSALTHFIPNCMTMIAGGILIIKGELTAGRYITFLFTFNMVSGTLQSLREFFVGARKAEASATRIYEMLEVPVEHINDYNKKEYCGKDEILFNSVHFSYNNKNEVLKNISLSIKKGEVVAIVGHSGCGKSTLLKLLSGFYYPNSGDINVFGYKLTEENINSIRNKISVVAQENYLFADTIRNNITLGNDTITDQQLELACRNAGIYDFIMSLPGCYDTILDEKGQNISGGQKQRICIARAFLYNKEILILDEPTSALDVITEEYLQKILSQLMKGKTVIIVAHKLSTIKSADKIVVMNKGEIAELGDHESLMAEEGIYYNLYMEKEGVQ